MHTLQTAALQVMLSRMSWRMVDVANIPHCCAAGVQAYKLKRGLGNTHSAATEADSVATKNAHTVIGDISLFCRMMNMTSTCDLPASTNPAPCFPHILPKSVTRLHVASRDYLYLLLLLLLLLLLQGPALVSGAGVTTLHYDQPELG